MPGDQFTRGSERQDEIAREGEDIPKQGRAIPEDRWAESEAAERQQDALAEELTDSAGRKVQTAPSGDTAKRGDLDVEVEQVHLSADPEPSRH